MIKGNNSIVFLGVTSVWATKKHFLSQRRTRFGRKPAGYIEAYSDFAGREVFGAFVKKDRTGNIVRSRLHCDRERVHKGMHVLNSGG